MEIELFIPESTPEDVLDTAVSWATERGLIPPRATTYRFKGYYIFGLVDTPFERIVWRYFIGLPD